MLVLIPTTVTQHYSTMFRVQQQSLDKLPPNEMFYVTFYQHWRPSKIVTGRYFFRRIEQGAGRPPPDTRVQVKNVPSTNFGRCQRHRQTACQVKPRNDSAPHTQNFCQLLGFNPKIQSQFNFLSGVSVVTGLWTELEQ